MQDVEEQQQEQETQQEVESKLGRSWPDLGQRSTSKSIEKNKTDTRKHSRRIQVNANTRRKRK